MKKNYILFVLLLLTAFAAVWAQDATDIPPKPSPPKLVNDFANILSPEEEAALERKLIAYNDSTSTQIAIVNVKSIGPYDISDFAYRLGETWGIGGKGKNNGILILTAVNERRVNISTGYGMEHIVPDAIAKRITEYTLKPQYKNNNFYAGLNEATDQLIVLAAGEYKADPKARAEGDGDGMLWLIIGALALFILLNLFRKKGGGRGGRGGRGMRTLGGPFFPPVVFGDFSRGSGPFGGGGGFGSGGGFGGFGGGSFGGGGASSSW